VGQSDTLIVGGDARTSWGRLSPANNRPVDTYGSYGVNEWVEVPGPPGALVCSKDPQWFWKTPDVKGASRIPLFADCWFFGGWPDPEDSAPVSDSRDARLPGDTDSMGRFCIDRHHAAINMVMLDYSVKKVGLKALWLQRWSKEFDLHKPPLTPPWPAWMAQMKATE
jgi:hypothetical protein